MTPSLTPALRMAADVGAVEVALAEMDPSGALVDRDAPIIVDDQRRACLRANRQRLARLARDQASSLSLTRNWMSRAPTPTSRATQAALSTMG